MQTKKENMQTNEQMDYSAQNTLYRLEEVMSIFNNDTVNLFVKELHKKQKIKILDFGAGVGTFSHIYCQKTGITPTCLEIDSSSKKYLKKRKFNVIENLDKKNDEFDGVFSSNVLEHIEDDQKILNMIFKSMKKQGRLVLLLPAFPILFSHFDESIGHYRRYRKSEIIMKCEKAGFKIEKSYFSDFLGFFLVLATKIFAYKKDAERELFNKKLLIIFDKIYFLSRLFDAIGGKYLLGKSVIIVASKK